MSLPHEIHLCIFCHLHYHAEATCFGLTNRHFWAIRKQIYGHLNRGKILITGELAVLIQDWMSHKYRWDAAREVFLTKKAFEERRKDRERKKEIIRPYRELEVDSAEDAEDPDELYWFWEGRRILGGLSR